MSAFSNALESDICNYMKGTQMPAPRTAWHVALFNGDPGEDGTTGTEITNTIRGTTTRSNLAVAGLTVTANRVSNTAAHVVTAAASGGATATHVAIFTTATGTTRLLFKGALSASKTINTGDEVRFDADQLALTVD